MKEAYVLITTRIIMRMEDDIEVGPVTEEMDYNFESRTEGVKFTDTKIREVTVAKIERNVD